MRERGEKERRRCNAGDIEPGLPTYYLGRLATDGLVPSDKCRVVGFSLAVFIYCSEYCLCRYLGELVECSMQLCEKSQPIPFLLLLQCRQDDSCPGFLQRLVVLSPCPSPETTRFLPAFPPTRIKVLYNKEPANKERGDNLRWGGGRSCTLVTMPSPHTCPLLVDEPTSF